MTHHMLFFRDVSVVFRLPRLAGIAVVLGMVALPPQLYGAQPGVAGAVAKVDSVAASGMDVNIDVTTGCSVDVVVHSATCGEVDRAAVIGNPAIAVSQSINFSGLLAHAFSCGPQFTVELEGIRSGYTNLPFRVDLDCDAQQVCSAKVSSGVLAQGAVPMTPQLASALDGIGAHTDLIADLHAAHPTLEDEIDTYAYHLAAWMGEAGQELSDGCLCQWTGVVDTLAASAPALATPGQPSVSATASASLTMVPRCFTLGSGAQRTLKSLKGDIFGSLPAFKTCAPPPGLQAEYGWEGEAWATAEGDLGFDASASLQIDVTADTSPVASHWVSAGRSAAALDDAAGEDLLLSAVKAPAPPQTLKVVLDGAADVDLTATAATFVEARTWAHLTLWGLGLGHPGIAEPGLVLAVAKLPTEVDDAIDDGECLQPH